MEERIKQAAKIIKDANKITVLTGAGISVESGIPDFRSANGLWSKYDPFEYAHIDSFRKNPYKVWEMLKEMHQILHGKKPNRAHIALKELEDMGKDVTIITQNVDKLHTIAGNSKVYEYHGVWDKLVCIKCGKTDEIKNYSLDEIPHCPNCNFPYKPDVVFFGEPIDPDVMRKSNEAAENCDVFMVIGTSAQVYPAAYLPNFAYRKGIPIIEVNLEPTPLTTSLNTIFLQGKATEIMDKLINEVKSQSNQ